jgi:hypothetical protein
MPKCILLPKFIQDQVYPIGFTDVGLRMGCAVPLPRLQSLLVSSIPTACACTCTQAAFEQRLRMVEGTWKTRDSEEANALGKPLFEMYRITPFENASVARDALAGAEIGAKIQLFPPLEGLERRNLRYLY